MIAPQERFGFRACGDDVTIYDWVRILDPERISIGSHVIIDDFVFIDGGEGLSIGSHVHIAGFSSLVGGGTIELGDFVGMAGGTRLVQRHRPVRRLRSHGAHDPRPLAGRGAQSHHGGPSRGARDERRRPPRRDHRRGRDRGLELTRHARPAAVDDLSGDPCGPGAGSARGRRSSSTSERCSSSSARPGDGASRQPRRAARATRGAGRTAGEPGCARGGARRPPARRPRARGARLRVVTRLAGAAGRDPSRAWIRARVAGPGAARIGAHRHLQERRAAVRADARLRARADLSALGGRGHRGRRDRRHRGTGRAALGDERIRFINLPFQAPARTTSTAAGSLPGPRRPTPRSGSPVVPGSPRSTTTTRSPRTTSSGSCSTPGRHVPSSRTAASACATPRAARCCPTSWERGRRCSGSSASRAPSTTPPSGASSTTRTRTWRVSRVTGTSPGACGRPACASPSLIAWSPPTTGPRWTIRAASGSRRSGQRQTPRPADIVSSRHAGRRSSPATESGPRTTSTSARVCTRVGRPCTATSSRSSAPSSSWRIS